MLRNFESEINWEHQTQHVEGALLIYSRDANSICTNSLKYEEYRNGREPYKISATFYSANPVGDNLENIAVRMTMSGLNALQTENIIIEATYPKRCGILPVIIRDNFVEIQAFSRRNQQLSNILSTRKINISRIVFKLDKILVKEGNQIDQHFWRRYRLSKNLDQRGESNNLRLPNRKLADSVTLRIITGN